MSPAWQKSSRLARGHVGEVITVFICVQREAQKRCLTLEPFFLLSK
jgi:hypothetical protein